MAPFPEGLLEIRGTPDERVEESLGLVFSGLPPEQRKLYVAFVTEEVRAARVSSEGLLEARRDSRLVGAAWIQVQPGRTAMVWPPRLVPGEPRSTGEMLLSDGCELLAKRGVRVAQALLTAPGPEEDAVLRAVGFEPLAALLYLGWEARELPGEWFGSLLEFDAYDPADPTRMERLVEATYVGTLDCPALNGLRSIEDVLAGYQSVGEFSPQWWLYARHEGRDVGCLILANHPREGNVELVYMGLIPEARGNGWGGQICRKAQRLAHQSGQARLVVAVDATNWPALAMYASAGFRVWDRRTVYLKRIAPR